MGREHTPFPRPYYTQPQYSCVNPTQYQGAHHPQSPWDESPYGQDNKPFMWSNRRNNVGYWPPPFPQPRSHLETPFYPQGPDPVQASIGQIASEMKRVSAQVAKLAEVQEGHTKAIKGILGRLESIESQLSVLEGGGAGVGASQGRKSGASRGGANKHPSLKVS